MPRVKREGSEEARAPKRVRGKNRTGGDVASLLKLHGIQARAVVNVAWPEAGRASLVETDVGPEAAFLARTPTRDKLVDVAWRPPVHWNAWQETPEPVRRRMELRNAAPIPLSVGSEAVHLAPYEAVSLPDPKSDRKVHLLDTGGHIYDMAWAPQADADSTCSSSPDAEWLAIARAPDRTTRSLVDAPLLGGDIQIWKFLLHQSTPTLHVVLESEGGTPLRLAWQPEQTGGLGVLAATYADGSVRIMRVPDEEAPTGIAADDVRVLRLASACFSLDWQGDRLAAGCVNGDVAVWDVASDLPLVHAPVHDTLVSAVRWQALPPVTTDGIPDAAQQPTTLLTLGWDGTELISDVHSMYTPVRLAHTREPRYAAAWAPYGGLFAVDLGDNHFGSVSLRTHDVGQHHALGFHHGRITALAASSCHPYVASGATDGSVKFTNVLGAGKRKTEDGSRAMHKSFRLSFKDARYILEDTFYPEGVWPQTATKTAPPFWHEWDASVAITALAYSPNPARALLLASGTALGMARIEWI